jgi:hypothetical protein
MTDDVGRVLPEGAGTPAAIPGPIFAADLDGAVALVTGGANRIGAAGGDRGGAAHTGRTAKYSEHADARRVASAARRARHGSGHLACGPDSSAVSFLAVAFLPASTGAVAAITSSANLRWAASSCSAKS